MIAAAALAATIAACSWDRPGANPFTGDVVAAVDRYQDIPVAVRQALKARMAARRYDEIATITRDGIAGAYRYEGLRDMHFGGGTVCRSVSRAGWPSGAVERGLVYCEQGHCLIVPTVCRNVSRVTRAARTTQPPPEQPVGQVLEVPGGPGGTSWAQRLGGLQRDEPQLRALAGGERDVPQIDWTADTGAAALPLLPETVEPIPEPSTWALMLAGLAGVWAVARRRTRR